MNGFQCNKTNDHLIMPLSKEVYFGNLKLKLCIYTITKNIHEGS